MSVIRFTYDRIACRLRGGLIRIPFVGKWSVPQWLVSACVYGWFALVAVWFIGECFFGCGANSDEYYMALCCRDYANQPIAMLTFYVGWLAMQIFGDQIITLRLMGCVCVLVGVGVPGLYCYRKTHSVRWALFIVACVLVAVRSQWLKWYGWDIGPIMYDGILITLLISLYDRLTLWRVVLTGCVAALTILARVPSAVIVAPVCCVALWIATKGCRQRSIDYLRYVGIWIVSLICSFLLCVTIMKGSPAAYLATWVPENVITGHGVKDASVFWYYVKFDTHMMVCEIWVAKYALMSILVLSLFSRRARVIPAIILVGYLLYRKLMLPNGMCVPRMALNLAVLLYPFLYNLKERLIGGRLNLKVDMRKFWTILFFGMIVAVGSDRMAFRMSYYYIFPLLLVSVYPIRRGMIFWTMLLLTLPSFTYSVVDRLKRIPHYRAMSEGLPYHKYIFADNVTDLYISACGAVMDELNDEERKITTFSVRRYEISYLYEKDKPYRLNTFHLYTDEDYVSALDDFTLGHDVIVVEDCTDIQPREKQIAMLSERNFYITATPANYLVFERIMPRRFITVSSVTQ